MSLLKNFTRRERVRKVTMVPCQSGHCDCAADPALDGMGHVIAGGVVVADAPRVCGEVMPEVDQARLAEWQKHIPKAKFR